MLAQSSGIVGLTKYQQIMHNINPCYHYFSCYCFQYCLTYSYFHPKYTPYTPWFNPPYSMNVKRNNFPRKNSFHNIFNKNTVKISYSCMRNISSIIASHNKSILRPKAEEYDCNCRNKDSCPLQNRCLTAKVIYEATVIKIIVTTKNGYTSALQIHPLRSDITTVREILIMNVTRNVQSY